MKGSASCWTASENRQLRRALFAGFLLLLVPAAIARLTGWRWRPWPPQPRAEGYGSIVQEARAAADNYVPFCFMGW